MNDKNKQKRGFLLILLAALTVYLWSFPLNKGTIELTVDPVPVRVLLPEGPQVCAQNSCLFKEKTGSLTLNIEKEGYFSKSQILTVKRFKTHPVSIKLEKIPDLKVSETEPVFAEPLLPPPVPEDMKGVAAWVWNAKNEKGAYWDPADEKIKVWQNGVDKVITVLKKPGANLKFLWSPDDIHLIGMDGSSVYLIDTQTASRRKRPLAFEPQNPLWSPQGDRLLINNKTDVHEISFATEQPKKLEMSLPLRQALWLKEDEIIYYVLDPEGQKMNLEKMNLNSGKSEKILEKRNFPISRIEKNDQGSVLVYQNAEKKWYSLDL